MTLGGQLRPVLRDRAALKLAPAQRPAQAPRHVRPHACLAPDRPAGRAL